MGRLQTYPRQQRAPGGGNIAALQDRKWQNKYKLRPINKNDWRPINNNYNYCCCPIRLMLLIWKSSFAKVGSCSHQWLKDTAIQNNSSIHIFSFIIFWEWEWVKMKILGLRWNLTFQICGTAEESIRARLSYKQARFDTRLYFKKIIFSCDLIFSFPSPHGISTFFILHFLTFSVCFLNLNYVGTQMKKIANEGEGTYIVHTSAGTLQLNNCRWIGCL